MLKSMAVPIYDDKHISCAKFISKFILNPFKEEPILNYRDCQLIEEIDL